MTMNTHIYRPYVMVRDDGSIEIDWSDCYEGSVDGEVRPLPHDPDPDGSEVLDRWVAEHPEVVGVVQEAGR